MAFSDVELLARLIKCEAGGEVNEIKEYKKAAIRRLFSILATIKTLCKSCVDFVLAFF